MKKQYHISESFQFKRTVATYHDGVLVASETLWMDEADEYADKLEDEGYVYGYTKREVESAKRRYEEMLENIIQ
jgi:hypothetical protein